MRPYSNALFVDGNIINDFLATLNITHRAVDNIIVNTSYTFEALEFKRFANFFTSYRISDRLATALQECKIGQHRYSFIYPNTFEKIRENILRDLKDFINEFSLPYLQSYYNWLDTKPIVGPYIEQKASTAQLRQIADYLKENHLYIYESLEKSIRENTQICLPNNEFYHLFDCKFTPIFSDEELQNMSDFANKIIKLENAGSSDVFRELAFLLYERGEVKTAHEFMQLANYLRPNGSFIAKHLKDYQQSLPDQEYKLAIYPNEYKINWATKEYRFSSTESKLSTLFHFCSETKERCKEYIARIRSFFYKLMSKN